MQNISLYSTRDYDKAILLHASGAILDSVEWDYSGKEATLVFEDESDCLDILRKHDKHMLEIDSHRWIEGRREINLAIHSR